MTRRTSSGDGGGVSFLERLPNSILNEILEKMALETLCSTACVCRTLRSSASQVLYSRPSLDLSSFSPDGQTLTDIVHKFGRLRTVTLDCLRLHDSSIFINLLGEHIQELNLLKGSSLSYQVLASIGQKCPNLRVLLLELAVGNSPEIFKRSLKSMLNSCSYLESVSIKNRGTEHDANGFLSMELSLPSTVKVLKLQPLFIQDAIGFIHGLGYSRICLNNFTNLNVPSYPVSLVSGLQSLSLVLDLISDELIISITNFIPFLVELDLEDRPSKEPLLPYDLTNRGLQSLQCCQQLTGLSLVRSKQNHSVSFKKVNDMAMFLLCECCKGLQSVRLGGFSKISDAGFAAILHSCRNLKKFEVCNASLISDLAFHDISGAPCSLVDVKLMSCNLITSVSVTELTSSSSKMEVLDLSGCRSVADSCLSSVSSLCKLTTLNLGGADIADGGMAIIGRGNSPITRLCLRGCKRITDKGVARLLNGGTFSKILSALDVGCLPGISDESIFTIAAFAPAITELCIRYCFSVTDASLEALALDRKLADDKKLLLRKLDLFRCHGLSVKSAGLLEKPSFRGLQWLGVGHTHLTTTMGETGFPEIRKERPWLTVCQEGCEMGCHDGWQFHRFNDY